MADGLSTVAAVPALMYHDVVPAGAEDTSGFHGLDAALYKVTTEAFAEQIAGIATLADRPTITFDDGGCSAMEAAEVLERYGLRGHFFITTDYIGSPGFLTARQLQDLHGRGHVLGTHSCSHPLRMAQISWPQLIHEWTVSCAVLSDILGCAVAVGSVPGGAFSNVVADAAAQAGILHLFTSEPTAEIATIAGISVGGRFTIRRSTSTTRVLAFARGVRFWCAQQRAAWALKKLTKRLGGSGYLAMRRALTGGTLK